MKICGLHSGHDCSFAILEDGVVTVHHEVERFTRKKMEISDSVEFLMDVYEDYKDIDYFIYTTTSWKGGIVSRYPVTYDKMWRISKGNVLLNTVGHHQAHAANAFFSSNFDEALIITIDGGGEDFIDGIKGNKLMSTSLTFWWGKGNKIEPLKIVSDSDFNVGYVWQQMTDKVFDLSVRAPLGSQEGTVMAMAAFGDKNKYDMSIPKMHCEYHGEIQKDKQNAFHIAASLQYITEKSLKKTIQKVINKHNLKNICVSGGVAMNSVLTGKFYEWYPNVKEIYIPPTPYDAGCAVGAAQYLWHHELDNPRIEWKDNYSSYGGFHYNKERIMNDLSRHSNIKHSKVTDDKIIELLDQQKIVSVYGGKSETGRRALGNRSILADPRSLKMKDTINEKVKHRQWFRPFAPSILREDVKDWFVRDINSPYMSFIAKFKDDKIDKVPAVVHIDKTARLQTVTKNDNKWYYNFIKKWKDKTGVPLLLNTSFNDREPIVETPNDAINCFLGTDIDYLYFYEDKILVERKKEKKEMTKILWLSENGLEGNVPRNFDQMRTDFAWFCASGGDHTNIGNIPNIPDNSYDVAIIILPKNEQVLHQISTYNGFDLIGQMKRIAKKIGWMQEGPVKYFHNYSIAIQTWYPAVLMSMDFLMVHNSSDEGYIHSLANQMPILINRSLMIEDALPTGPWHEPSARNGVMIGGNFVSWYGGFDSFMVARHFETDIFAPSMGRMNEDEKQIDGLQHISYKTWQEWMISLSEYKYAVHLMPTAAAGTFALNCAYLGIPCIGNKDIDTQKICHSDLSVDLNGGVGTAIEMAKQLKNEPQFYDYCASRAKTFYNKHYNEEIWKKNFFTFVEQKVFSVVK